MSAAMPVERAARLERAGLLEELRLEAHGAERADASTKQSACGGRAPRSCARARSTSSIDDHARETTRATAPSRTVNDGAAVPARSRRRRVPPIASRQLLHDREAEPGADRPLAPVPLVQVEALERARRGRRPRGPGPVSSTRSTPGAVTTRTSPPARRQAQRVLDEVRDDLEHAVGVGDRRRRAVGDGARARRRSASACCW